MTELICLIIMALIILGMWGLTWKIHKGSNSFTTDGAVATFFFSILFTVVGVIIAIVGLAGGYTIGPIVITEIRHVPMRQQEIDNMIREAIERDIPRFATYMQYVVKSQVVEPVISPSEMPSLPVEALKQHLAPE